MGNQCLLTVPFPWHLHVTINVSDETCETVNIVSKYNYYKIFCTLLMLMATWKAGVAINRGTPWWYSRSQSAFRWPRTAHSYLHSPVRVSCCADTHHVSAPVSTRNNIFVFLSLTKMRRVPMPSSFAVSTDGWSRFPTSKCMGNDSPSRVLRTLHGRSKGRLAAADLGSANGGGIAYASVIVVVVDDGYWCTCVIRWFNTLIATANSSLVPAGGSISVVIRAVRR